MKGDVGSPLALDFLSPSVGFAVPDGNGGVAVVDRGRVDLESREDHRRPIHGAAITPI
jgi:hypothetical protein